MLNLKTRHKIFNSSSVNIEKINDLKHIIAIQKPNGIRKESKSILANNYLKETLLDKQLTNNLILINFLSEDNFSLEFIKKLKRKIFNSRKSTHY